MSKIKNCTADGTRVGSSKDYIIKDVSGSDDLSNCHLMSEIQSEDWQCQNVY